MLVPSPITAPNPAPARAAPASASGAFDAASRGRVATQAHIEAHVEQARDRAASPRSRRARRAATLAPVPR